MWSGKAHLDDARIILRIAIHCVAAQIWVQKSYSWLGIYANLRVILSKTKSLAKLFQLYEKNISTRVYWRVLSGSTDQFRWGRRGNSWLWTLFKSKTSE